MTAMVVLEHRFLVLIPGVKSFFSTHFAFLAARDALTAAFLRALTAAMTFSLNWSIS
jgi:hypothetical protein